MCFYLLNVATENKIVLVNEWEVRKRKSIKRLNFEARDTHSHYSESTSATYLGTVNPINYPDHWGVGRSYELVMFSIKPALPPMDYITEVIVFKSQVTNKSGWLTFDIKVRALSRSLPRDSPNSITYEEKLLARLRQI